jgi:cell division septal protein FtsQ
VAAKRAGTRARVREAAAELPRGRRIDWARLAPSGRSLAAGFLLLALAIAGYAVASETSLFAIRKIEVVSASPAVREQVHAALEPSLAGRSLVGLRRQDVDRPLASVADVAAARYDRAFPHTLRVYVLAEQALAVLRRGAESWLLSTRGRVLRPLRKGARPRLPRLWVPKTVEVGVGDVIADETAARGVRALAAAAAAELPVGVRTVRLDPGETTVILRNGLQVRLGREHDLRLKLAVAASVLPELGPGTTYLDVAVPDRPVANE